MSLVDDELERRVRERLAGLDEMTFQRGSARPSRRLRAQPLLVAAGCLAAVAAAVGLVTARRAPAPAARITTAPAPRIDPVAHLPALRPGALRGVVYFDSGPCARGTIDLGTLQQAATPAQDVCARRGASLGVATPTDHIATKVDVVDLGGQRVAKVTIPTGFALVDIGRDGIAFCNLTMPFVTGTHGILGRFTGGKVALPSCPVAPDGIGGGFLYLTADRREVVDQSGRLRARAAKSIPTNTRVRVISEHLVAVGTDLYRDGQLVASFDEPLGYIVSASADGQVVLVSDGLSTHLSLYRHGVRRDIAGDIATLGGAVSPDGRDLLLPHGPNVVVAVDATTLRPSARLDLTRGYDQYGTPLFDLWSWR